MIFGPICGRTIRHTPLLGSSIVTRYLEVAHEIAERVRAGELSIGAELAAVREAVHEHGATSTTVSRAYRHLADAGVKIGRAHV